jgi:hypothetical protein
MDCFFTVFLFLLFSRIFSTTVGVGEGEGSIFAAALLKARAGEAVSSNILSHNFLEKRGKKVWKQWGGSCIFAVRFYRKGKVL